MFGRKGSVLFSHRVGRIEIKDKWEKHKFNLEKYSKKTTTWVLSRDKIESLIKKIECESGKGYPFFIAGKTSFLAKSAETYDIHDPILGTLASKHEELFLKLYDSYCNEKKPTGMKEKEFNKVIAKIFGENIKYDYQYFMRIFEKEEISSKEIKEENCFTWAKNQLKYLGIELEETESFKNISRVASVTSLQVLHSIKANGKHLVVDLTKDESLITNIDVISKPISHRTVTYEKRDKRTEAFKVVKKEINNLSVKNTIGISSFITGTVISGIGFWGVITTAPVSVPVIIGSTVLGCSGFIISCFQSEKMKSIEEEINTHKKITPKETEEFKKNKKKIVFF